MMSMRFFTLLAFLILRFLSVLTEKATKNCVDNEYTIGKWIYNNDSAVTKNFICCQSTNNDYMQPICVPNLERRGFVGSSEGYMLFHDDVCSCDRDQGTRFKVSERERYQWTPSECTLLEWDASQFCELLGDRKILFLGDSSNGHSAVTLINMINDADEVCSENIRFVSMPLLELSVLSAADVTELKKDFPDFIIASAGHHFHEDSGKEDFKAAFDLFVETLTDYQSQFARTKAGKQRRSYFIWKSINPPHIHCNKYSAPTTERVPFLHSMDPQCKWDWFDWYDEYARNVTTLSGHSSSSGVSASSAPQMSYLDMSPLLYRPDAHPKEDCLHYCAPGPLDLFSRLLLHRLHILLSQNHK